MASARFTLSSVRAPARTRRTPSRGIYAPIIAYSASSRNPRREAAPLATERGTSPLPPVTVSSGRSRRPSCPIGGGWTCYIALVTRRPVAAFGLALLLWIPRAALAAPQSPTGAAADELLAARKMFLAARSAVADGQFQEALGLYRKVIAKLPSDPVVHLEYAQLLRDLNVV